MKIKCLMITLFILLGASFARSTNISGQIEYFYMTRLDNSQLVNIPFSLVDFNIQHQVTDDFNIMGNFGIEYRNRKDYEMSRKIWSNQRKEKFHIITCQFAYHYMWESKYHYQSFMSNVEDNLVDGGYFIATYLDGQEVFKKLLDSPNGQIPEDSDTWKIIRRYESEDLDVLVLVELQSRDAAGASATPNSLASLVAR